MKISLSTVTGAGMLVFLFLAGCDSPSQKVQHAKEDLQAAKYELSKAQRDSAADYESFRKEAEEIIANNDKAIAAFKERMAGADSKDKARDQEIIDKIEQRNIDLRKKIVDFRENGKDEWLAFKLEFTHDLDELGTALKGLGVNNTK